MTNEPTTAEGGELKPCGHCASIMIAVSTGAGLLSEGSGKWADRYFCGECETCGAFGPRALTKADAIAAWNRRASPDLSAARAQALREAEELVRLEGLSYDEMAVGMESTDRAAANSLARDGERLHVLADAIAALAKDGGSDV